MATKARAPETGILIPSTAYSLLPPGDGSTGPTGGSASCRAASVPLRGRARALRRIGIDEHRSGLTMAFQRTRWTVGLGSHHHCCLACWWPRFQGRDDQYTTTLGIPRRTNTVWLREGSAAFLLFPGHIQDELVGKVSDRITLASWFSCLSKHFVALLCNSVSAPNSSGDHGEGSRDASSRHYVGYIQWLVRKGRQGQEDGNYTLCL